MKTKLVMLAFIATIISAPAYSGDQLPPAQRPTAEEDAASYARDREILRQRRESGQEDKDAAFAAEQNARKGIEQDDSTLDKPQPTAAPVPIAAVLGANDLARMHKTYSENELKFEKMFVGKRFGAVLPFNSASKGWFGAQNVYVGTGTFGGGDIMCSVSNGAEVTLVEGLSKGDAVRVNGTVKDSLMTFIILDDCSISGGARN
jgi:hypothetical protein